jgi:hypothetical protein
MLDIPWLPATLEETQRVGYGVTPPDSSDAGAPGADEDRKNAEYRASLTEAAQREYDLALVGYYDEVSAQDAAALARACRSQAAERHPAPEIPAEASLWDAAVEPLRAIGGAFSDGGYCDARGDCQPGSGPYAPGSDPRSAELTSEYDECVARAGVGWTPVAKGIRGLQATATQIGRQGQVWTDWSAEGESVLADTIPEEHRRLVGSKAEVDIAVVDFKCRQETDYVNRQAQIVADSQARYLADHRAAFDQMMADLERLGTDL